MASTNNSHLSVLKMWLRPEELHKFPVQQQNTKFFLSFDTGRGWQSLYGEHSSLALVNQQPLSNGYLNKEVW